MDRSVIRRIRREIGKIRAYIQSQSHDGKLTDIDTLLSVAESEADRQIGAASSKPENADERK